MEKRFIFNPSNVDTSLVKTFNHTLSGLEGDGKAEKPASSDDQPFSLAEMPALGESQR
jgi:hypothetical protein